MALRWHYRGVTNVTANSRLWRQGWNPGGVAHSKADRVWVRWAHPQQGRRMCRSQTSCVPGVNGCEKLTRSHKTRNMVHLAEVGE
jgi:hypothetical protein